MTLLVDDTYVVCTMWAGEFMQTSCAELYAVECGQGPDRELPVWTIHHWRSTGSLRFLRLWGVDIGS